MANERGYFAVRTTKRDAFVDTMGEVGNTVFEIMVSNLQDAWKKKVLAK